MPSGEANNHEVAKRQDMQSGCAATSKPCSMNFFPARRRILAEMPKHYQNIKARDCLDSPLANAMLTFNSVQSIKANHKGELYSGET